MEIIELLPIGETIILVLSGMIIAKLIKRVESLETDLRHERYRHEEQIIQMARDYHRQQLRNK